MVDDLLAETGRRVKEAQPASADEVRGLAAPLVAFSPDLKKADQELRGFLFENMYRHYRVNRSISKAKRVVSDLFELFLAEPGVLPTEWQGRCGAPQSEGTARVVCDYIAGMTDRYALLEHRRLFQVDPLV
jgi:dGTPase